MKPITTRLTPKAMRKYLVEEVWPKIDYTPNPSDISYAIGGELFIGPYKVIITNVVSTSNTTFETPNVKIPKKKLSKGLKTKRVRPRAAVKGHRKPSRKCGSI